MIRWLTLLLALLPGLALAQNVRIPESPALSVEVIVAGGEGAPVFVQQQVLLKITLISRHPFRTLQIETPAIRDSEVHVASRAKTREFTSYVGSGWRHQRVLALFPSKSGPWEIPQITATGSVTGPGGTTQGFESGAAARQIEVLPAHPYLRGFWWVAAEDISLSEEWSRELAGMKIGDTVRRTVRMTAKGTTAERLPEMQQGTTPGISVHDTGRENVTRFSPDGAIAEVVRSWDITVNSDDPVNIAPVSVTWWRTGESRPASSGVPAARIEPLAVNGDELRRALLAEAAAERDLNAGLLLAIILLLAAPAALLGGAVLLALAPTPADLRLRRRLRGRNAADCIGPVVAWAQTSVDPGIGTVGELARLAPADIGGMLYRLQRAAYGRHETGQADIRALTRWSRRLRLQRLRTSIIRMAEHMFGAPVSV